MQSNRLKGILYILSAALFFSLMSIFVRLAGDIPTFEKAFFRNFVAVIVVGITIKRKGISTKIGKKNLPYVLARALLGTFGILANFYAIDRLHLADANMLNKLSPFFAIVFSYFLLNERVKPVQAIAVVGAFIGALCIIKPSGENLLAFPAIIGFLGGVAAGGAYTCLRKATQGGVQGPVVVMFFSVLSCLIILPLMLRDFVVPTAHQLAMLLLCGACATGGQFSITAAYSHAPAKEISVYDYSQVIFSAIFGFFLFHQIPDGWSFLGYGLIIAMAILNFVYNNRRPSP